MPSEFVADATAFLESAGYSRPNIVPDCAFTVRADDGQLRRDRVDLVAFAQHPHDMRNACIAALDAKQGYQEELSRLRYLTTPLAIVGHTDKVELWSIRAAGSEQPFDVFDRAAWRDRVRTRLTDFSPRTITDAKNDRIQLDFVDAGLGSWTRSITNASLKTLLEDLIAAGFESLSPANQGTELAQKAVLRLIFSLFTCRVLEDKKVVPAQDDARATLTQASRLFSDSISPDVLESRFISKRLADLVFTRLKSEFSFETLTTDILSHSYENALVTRAGRHELGIYYTPRQVTEYILKRLPIETIPEADRVLMDPCCGCGSFLIAGFDRLAALLPDSMSPKDRHQYLRKRIIGSDVDPLAREIASLALVLTDLHNHNGWEVREQDASQLVKRDLTPSPTIIATNLPFKEIKLGKGERRELSADILANLVELTPKDALFGVILPQSFLDSKAARAARESILRNCAVLEIALLPGAVFESAAETAVLFLRKQTLPEGKAPIATVREVRASEYNRFVQNGAFTRTYPVDPADWQGDSERRFLVSPLSDLWKRLESELPKLSESAEIKNGLQIKSTDRSSVSDKKRDNRDRRFIARLDVLRPFALLTEHGLEKTKWIRYGNQLHRMRDPEIFKAAKVLINSNRNPGSAWRIVAAISRKELFFSDNFHGVIPKPGVTPEQIAAILNSPIANAWFDSRCRKRKVVQATLRALPCPKLDSRIGGRMDELVRKMEQAVIEKWKQHDEGMFYDALVETSDTASLQSAIDELVYDAYGLSPHERKQVTTLMSTDKRPS